MGCLNDEGKFEHWFGNIHLSGPCNRSCYFCIGQHMMALDRFNNLNELPKNLGSFLDLCKDHKVKEICLTGTNTDPMLYQKTAELTGKIREKLAVPLAIRTNAVKYDRATFGLFDRASVTICSFDPEIYRKMMGSGSPPDLKRILANHPNMDVKVNVVLGSENVDTGDVFRTLDTLVEMGVKRVNLREPYGQPHVGDPMPKELFHKHVLGMPCYLWLGTLQACYWDVHYVEVESVNLYANGRISITYPITLGHADTGEVHNQTFFPGGRVREQWVHTNN